MILGCKNNVLVIQIPTIITANAAIAVNTNNIALASSTGLSRLYRILNIVAMNAKYQIVVRCPDVEMISL